MFSHHQGKAGTGKTHNAIQEFLSAGQLLGIIYKNKPFLERNTLQELKKQIGDKFEKYPLQYESVWHLEAGQVIKVLTMERIRGQGVFDAILIDDEDWSMRELAEIHSRAGKVVWAHDLMLV